MFLEVASTTTSYGFKMATTVTGESANELVVNMKDVTALKKALEQATHVANTTTVETIKDEMKNLVAFYLNHVTKPVKLAIEFAPMLEDGAKKLGKQLHDFARLQSLAKSKAGSRCRVRLALPLLPKNSANLRKGNQRRKKGFSCLEIFASTLYPTRLHSKSYTNFFII